MSEHTHGPWTILPRPGTDVIHIMGESVPGAMLTTIAQMSAGTILSESLEANARLIAAAPELLAALEALLDDGHIGDGNRPATRQALAALAKARGES
jgi:hypothetical protein